jgi:hypothetical protein
MTVRLSANARYVPSVVIWPVTRKELVSVKSDPALHNVKGLERGIAGYHRGAQLAIRTRIYIGSNHAGATGLPVTGLLKCQ